jgi:Protein of unknown function (DUF3892)
MAGQDEKQTPDGMWMATMGAFEINAFFYKAIGTKVDVFHKEQRRSGPFGWSGPLVDKWVPANADSIRIRNIYYGATAAAANAYGLGYCPPPGEFSGARPSLDCRVWAVGIGGSWSWDKPIGLSGDLPGGLPPNPTGTPGAILDVRAVSGTATVSIGTWDPLILRVQSGGFPPEFVVEEGQALTSAPPAPAAPPASPAPDVGDRITCVRVSSEGRIAEIGGTEADGLTWRLPLESAVARMQRGHEFFVERPEGDRVAVEIAVSALGRRYLKTEADGDEPNNLLALPRC